MKDKVKDLLPVGSVVLLKEAEKKLIIMGIMQKDLQTGETYDYVTVPYPEGFISKDVVFYVQHKNIDKVIFNGYSDIERDELLKKLDDFYQRETRDKE